LLAPDDLAAIRGDGIFEAALLRDDQIRALDLHLERFANSARLLDLAGSCHEIWRPALLRAVELARVPDGDGVIRWFLSRGREGTDTPHGWILIGDVPQAALDERANGIAAVTLTRGLPAGMPAEAPWLLIGAKTLSYAVALAANRFARARGAGDAIYTTTDGFVLEAPRSNVIIACGNTLLTPDPSLGLLHGTTQQFIFERAAAQGWDCRYARLRLNDLFQADGVWLVSSIRTSVRVHHLNGTELPIADGLDDAMKMLLA
ncbi:MAG TPA: aminodeoxychorismate lyase, partial [Actinomycetaceae bacterium]|nr:aminodeoxychorismate lyase [Actinomycetaceae bacterium]